MVKSVSVKLTLVTTIALATLVACGDSDKKDDEAAAAASSLLRYVPADSPYVLARLAPLPEDVADKLEPQVDRMLKSYEVILQEIVAIASAEAADGEADAEEAEKASAVLDEISSLMSIEGLRDAGIEEDSRVIFYGNGLLPVLRAELSDGALFEAALERIETSAGEKLEVTSISGHAVRFIVTDNAKILVAVLEKQVVISAAPAGFNDEQLSSLLGFTAPAEDILSAGVLQGITSKHGFSDYLVGYLDVQKVVATVTGGATGLDADLLALAGDRSDLSDVCRAEFRAMAGIAPRMVMGFTGITTERFDSRAVVELRDDIATGLKTWPAAVPGLGKDAGGLMAFGMSIDVMAVRNFFEAQLNAIEAEPFKCDKLAQLQAAVAQGRLVLQQPVPPVVYDFRGVLAVIQNIEGLDLATNTPPTSVDGQFLIAMNNAPALMSLGTMMIPALAGLNLQADGKAVLLDLPQTQALGGDVYVAMNDDAIALSVGNDAEDQLGGMLSADAADDGTFLSFSMDAGRYYAFLGEAMTVANDADNPMPPKFKAATQDMMRAISEIYDRMSVNVRFTDDGVVMDSVVLIN